MLKCSQCSQLQVYKPWWELKHIGWIWRKPKAWEKKGRGKLNALFCPKCQQLHEIRTKTQKLQAKLAKKKRRKRRKENKAMAKRIASRPTTKASILNTLLGSDPREYAGDLETGKDPREPVGPIRPREELVKIIMGDEPREYAGLVYSKDGTKVLGQLWKGKAVRQGDEA